MIRAALLSTLFAVPALAQDAAPAVGQPLDPKLNGTWELVDVYVPNADVNPVRMTVTFDGNEAITKMTFMVDGELREEVFTAECGSIDEVVQCVTTGDKAGRHNGFGRPAFDGDMLRFTLPMSDDYYAVFRRVEE